jgi:hypothetical protein
MTISYLLTETGSEFEGLPYYAEFRWLSCYYEWKSFSLLGKEILVFFEM